MKNPVLNFEVFLELIINNSKKYIENLTMYR